MNNYRSLSIVVIGVLLLSFLAACRPATPGQVLLSEYRGQAFTPVAAVEANGTRHFAWTEPDSVYSQQAMVYARAYPDGKFNLVEWHSPSVGVNYVNPDLVVTDGGNAYLSYTGCSYTPSRHCDAFITAFGKSWGGGPPASPQSAWVGPNGLVLVQRGNWVYVLGTSDPDPLDPYTSSLSYKQLSGGSRQGLVAEETDFWAAEPSGVIDNAGDLHVAFRSFSHLLLDRIGYANNVESTGNMGAALYYPVSGGFPTPSISLAEGSGDIYVAYAHGLALDSLSVWRTYPPPIIDPEPLDLGPATGWHLSGSPALAAFGDGNYWVIFSASNDAAAINEIWAYVKTVGDPVRITNDAINDSPPLAVKGVTEQPVYAWRTTHRQTEPPYDECFGDVKVVTIAIDPTIQTIFADQGTCDNPGFDLAVNGKEGLGVWLDVRNNKTLPEPWYAIDWLESFLPAIRK